jgi:hypothetical protein
MLDYLKLQQEQVHQQQQEGKKTGKPTTSETPTRAGTARNVGKTSRRSML